MDSFSADMHLDYVKALTFHIMLDKVIVWMSISLFHGVFALTNVTVAPTPASATSTQTGACGSVTVRQTTHTTDPLTLVTILTVWTPLSN